MRKISLWAKHHRLFAIVTIIVSKILLAIIAFNIGLWLLEYNIHIPVIVVVIALAIFVIAALLYPSKYQTRLSKKQVYIKQKSCDFIIAACTFIMMATLTNVNMPLPLTISATASNVVTNNNSKAEEILTSLKYRDKSTLTKQEKRILKKEFKKQLKLFAIAKITGDKEGGDKSWLIILTIIAALGLLFLVAALACGIGCGGSEVGAGLVAVIGTAAIVWGTIAVIRRITKGPKRERIEPEMINQ